MSIHARARVDIVIYEGATFRQTFQWKQGDPAEAVDLTGYTARMHIRESMESETALLELDSEGGGAVINDPPTDGKYSVYIPAADTAGLCADHERINAVYDILLIKDDVVLMQQHGKARIFPSVTRDE